MENKTFITADAERNIPVTEPDRESERKINKA